MGCIVAGVSLAVCAGPVLAAGSDDVGSMTIEDMVAWTQANAALVMGVLGLLSMIILWRVKVLRVGGLDSGARDVKPIPAIMWFFAAGATFFAISLGAQAAMQLPVVEDAPVRDAASSQLISAGFGSVFGIGMLWFVRRQAEKGGTKPDWVDIPLGLGLFVVIYPLVALSGILSHWIARGFDTVEQDRLAHDTLQLIAANRGDSWMWVLVGVLVLLVPLVEELIYRVFLQSGILRIVRSRWLAVVLTSALFAASHWAVLPEGGKHAIGPLFALSVAIGAAYERTGRLGVPIVIHSAYNAFNLFLAMVVDPMGD